VGENGAAAPRGRVQGLANGYFKLKEKDFGRLIIEENKGKFFNLL